MDARIALRLLHLLSFAALLCACTKDFSRFQFRDLPPDPKPQAGSSATSEAGSDAALSNTRVDAGGHGGGQSVSAGRGGSGARAGNRAPSAGAGSGGMSGGASPRAGNRAPLAADEDAGMVVDASMPQDASQPPPDAGPSIEQQCTSSANRELVDVAAGCTRCACSDCAPSVLTCLEQGEGVYDRPCRDLLKCAITNGCRDWDCYCTDPGCRANPDADGNGPCVNEMNAAAGGTQDRAAVNAAHAANNPSSPLIMAVRATTCIFGGSRSSGSTPVEGPCKTQCEAP